MIKSLFELFIFDWGHTVQLVKLKVFRRNDNLYIWGLNQGHI